MSPKDTEEGGRGEEEEDSFIFGQQLLIVMARVRHLTFNCSLLTPTHIHYSVPTVGRAKLIECFFVGNNEIYSLVQLH